jgi:hypothetical protein
VATGLGLPAPKATIELAQLDPGPALSQLGGEYPPDGRTVGIVIDPDGDLSGIGTLRATIDAAGVVPLLIAPHGGTVEGNSVSRTFETGRSVEFDVLLVAGASIPAPDALPARDEKAGADEKAAVDPRVLLMLEECYRHAKVIGAYDGLDRERASSPDEEEKEWFPQVREGLGRKALQEVGAEMEAPKRKAPTSPAQPSALKKTIDAVISAGRTRWRSLGPAGTAIR